MPLRLDIKKKLSATSDRVKSVDIHPTEPWVLSALYSGNVMIWDYETSTCVKSFELSDLPVRCAKFIARKQWFIAASDDMKLRVYNYNTMEKVKEFEAHQDYIRFVEIHPTLPYFLSCSDDSTIKLWDWERNFDFTQHFEGHAHYVMQVKFNPKDTNVFASASLDRTIKVWGLGSPAPHYTLEGHESGVNCIDYYPSGDKPYILSGADDHTVKIWDYQTKSIVHTLTGHTNNVCAVLFHPKLPLIASASEDGTIRLWQSTTYRAETTLNYGMERAWALAAVKEANMLACGFDEGCVVIELGSDEPVASMDSTGKIVWAKNNEILTATVRGLASSSGDGNLSDGERLPIAPRELGSCELYPSNLKHNCNGRYIAVCGDGEFIIYTAQALRNKAFGQALDFVWSAAETGDYAIRESISRVKIFKNFKDFKTITPATSSSEGLFGGRLVGIKGGDGSVLFYDWDTGAFVRKIDVAAKEVYWSDEGNMVCVACQETAYVLRYNAQVAASAIAMGKVSAEDGIEGTFDLLYEINDVITSGKWVGDCFIYMSNAGRLNYSVGGKIQTIVHLETSASGSAKHSILGYLAKEDRVYLVDKAFNVLSYKVMLTVLQYQTAVMRGDFDAANELLASIPESQYTTIARFLESQGFKEEALAVSTDPDHKFDLSLELGHIDIAHSLMGETPEEEKETTETMTKWKRLSDAALKDSNFELCESASFACNDFSGLLLLYSALGNLDGMESLAKAAETHGKVNIAFTAYLLTGNIESCLNILISSSRFPEAAFFARTYMPSRVNEMVALWKTDLAKISETASKALASPSNHASLFPDFEIALQVETMFIAQRESAKLSGFPSVEYVTAKDDLDLDLISLIKSRSSNVESSAVVIDDEANVGNTGDYTSPHESVPQHEEDERLQQDKTMILEQERLPVTDDIMLEDEAPDEEFMEANIEEDKTLDAPVTKEDNDFADDWE